MALVSSGQLSLGTIADNKDSASRSDVSLAAISVQFASGSAVGDVDGNESANQTADRDALNTAGFAISEFYDAEFVNEFYDTVVAQLADGTVVTGDGYVDGESGRISFDVNDATLGNSYTVGLKNATTNVVIVEETATKSGTGTKTINFTAPSIAADNNFYYPFVSTGTFENAAGSNIDHYDAIGAVSITDPDASGIPTVSNLTTNTSITHARSIADESSINDYNWSFVKTSGDGDGVSDGEGSFGTVTATVSLPTVVYRGPGIFTAALRVDGDPSQGRNSTTATTVTHEIEYVNLTTINSISSVNATTAVTVAGTNKGLSGGVTFGLVDTGATTTFLSGKSANDTVDSRYISQAYTADITAADSNSTLTLQGRVIDRSDSTTNQNRNTSTFSVFPLLTTGKNTINAGTNTVYSSTNNSAGTTFNGDSTSYVNTVAYGTPGTATDNVTAYAYGINTAPTGWSFSAASSATTNFAGGTGVSTGKTVTLTVTSTAAAGDSASDQSTATTHTLALLFKPCIIAITHTAGTIVINSTDVVVTALSWQGFAEATGFKLAGVNAAGQLVSENNDVTYGNTEGSTTTQISKTSLSINLGNFDEAGTMTIRVKKHNATSEFRDFNITISDFTSIVIQGVGAGYGTPEQALIAKGNGGAGWANTSKQLQPGDSFGNGIVLFDDNEGTVFNGGAVYHGTKPGSTTSYFSVGTNGAIGNIFVGDAAIPPRAPSGLGTSPAQTAIAVSNFAASEYIFSNSGTTTATFDSQVTTKTVTVTWTDVSSINETYSIFDTNSSGAELVSDIDADVETQAITGITGNKTFAVHALGNGITGGGSVLSLGTVATSYSHSNNGSLFLHATKANGDQVNVDDITSGTTFTWDKDVLSAGEWTLRMRYTSYTGTTIATVSNFTVSAEQSISFDPTSISTIDVEDGGSTFSGVIHATIAGGYHGSSGDSTLIAISGDGNFSYTLNAQQASDPGSSGTGAGSVTVDGSDNDIFFRIRAREVGGSNGDTGDCTVTITHSATGQSNIVGTFEADAEVTDA